MAPLLYKTISAIFTSQSSSSSKNVKLPLKQHKKIREMKEKVLQYMCVCLVIVKNKIAFCYFVKYLNCLMIHMLPFIKMNIYSELQSICWNYIYCISHFYDLTKALDRACFNEISTQLVQPADDR